MGLLNGQTIDQSDFIKAADKDPVPANDENRVPQLESNGKLDPAFIPGTVVDFLAEENLTAGMPVGISIMPGETVARARRYHTSFAHGIVSPLFNESVPQRWCPIGGDKIVLITYTAAAADTLFAQVVDYDQDTLIAIPGTAAAVATAFNPAGSGLLTATVCKLGTDKFIVFYLLDSSTTVVKCRVGTVSGTTITFGAEQTAFTAATTVATSESFNADYIGTDKCVLLVKAATASSTAVTAFSVSGTVATAGTSVTTGGNNQLNFASYITRIATDKFVIVTTVTSLLTYAQVFTLSGTTITAGAETLLANTTSETNRPHMSLCSPADNVFVFRWCRSAVGNTLNLVACTVSGTTITVGTVRTDLGAIGGGSIVAKSATRLILTGGYNSSFLNIYELTLSGTTITGTPGTFVGNRQFGGYMLFLNSDNGKLIGLQINNTAAFKYWIEGMSNNLVGIVQNSVTKGGTAKVLIRGVDTNQIGLIPGSHYVILDTENAGGVLTLVGNENDGASFAQQKAFVAVSATKLLV